MDLKKNEVENKIKDINAIDFGDSVDEITSSLMIVMTLFEVDDHPEIIKACKYKLYEGISLLKKFGEEDKARDIEQKVKKD
ncbi:MAG: hypothetical protein R3345_08705 [Fulvivirga sp.]|nr:hypothetical protein [Fulvivirga sp.]